LFFRLSDDGRPGTGYLSGVALFRSCQRYLLPSVAYWLFACSSGDVQRAREYVSTHSHAIRSLTDTDDFSDLTPIAAAIGDARIVQLGESSHGSGCTNGSLTGDIEGPALQKRTLRATLSKKRQLVIALSCTSELLQRQTSNPIVAIGCSPKAVTAPLQASCSARRDACRPDLAARAFSPLPNRRLSFRVGGRRAL